jgi:hypothetical protein
MDELLRDDNKKQHLRHSQKTTQWRKRSVPQQAAGTLSLTREPSIAHKLAQSAIFCGGFGNNTPPILR